MLLFVENSGTDAWKKLGLLIFGTGFKETVARTLLTIFELFKIGDPKSRNSRESYHSAGNPLIRICLGSFRPVSTVLQNGSTNNSLRFWPNLSLFNCRQEHHLTFNKSYLWNKYSSKLLTYFYWLSHKSILLLKNLFFTFTFFIVCLLNKNWGVGNFVLQSCFTVLPF